MPTTTTSTPRRRSRRNRTRPMVLAGALTAALVAVGSGVASAEPPRAIPPAAEAEDNKWQPAMDYDTDSCYNTPAIGPGGDVAEGLLTNKLDAAEDGCRDASDLDNTNVYERTSCQNGWCAHMYAYYFEKDKYVSGVAGGHRHDWEHVIVWVNDNQAKFVSVSAHGEYAQTRPARDVRFHGDTHPKVVYHKEGGSTHAMRFANADDDAVENHSGQWRVSGLVGWGQMDGGLRDTLVGHDFGAATLDLKNGRFQRLLNEDAAEEDIPMRK